MLASPTYNVVVMWLSTVCVLKVLGIILYIIKSVTLLVVLLHLFALSAAKLLHKIKKDDFATSGKCKYCDVAV